MAGTLKAPIVVDEATLRELLRQCANGGTAVIEGDFRVHAFWKTTENRRRMLSMQLWATNQEKPTNLKDIVWKLIQAHPEIDHWKVSEMHKRWLRAYSTHEITKTIRLLEKDRKVMIDPNGSRWDSCWFRVAQPS
jgi:hypothetical protein